VVERLFIQPHPLYPLTFPVIASEAKQSLLSTSPPVSPSPYEVSKERGKKKKEGRKPLLDSLDIFY